MEGSQGGSQGGGKAVSSGVTRLLENILTFVIQSTYGKDTLRPVTIKQVLEAQQPYPQAEFKIDDVEVSQVRLCPEPLVEQNLSYSFGVQGH